MNGITSSKPVLVTDLLLDAGFTRLAKIEKAIELGFHAIGTPDIKKFARKLRQRRQEFAFQNIEDYQTSKEEIIPEGELKKVALARKSNLFDKMIVVGTKPLRLKRLNPDPLVVGLIFSEETKQQLIERRSIPRGVVMNERWYLIAAWK